MQSHTILLVQPAQDKRTRTFDFFSTQAQAIDEIIRRFEEHLKNTRPQARQITYDVKELFQWLDGMVDISALVLDTRVNKYDPHPKDWIKQQIFNRLKQQAAPPQRR